MGSNGPPGGEKKSEYGLKFSSNFGDVLIPEITRVVSKFKETYLSNGFRFFNSVSSSCSLITRASKYVQAKKI